MRSLTVELMALPPFGRHTYGRCIDYALYTVARALLPFAEREKIRIAKLLKKMSKKKKRKAAVFKSTVALLQLRNILNTY